RRASTSSCPTCAPTPAPSSRPCARARSTRRSSTARCAASWPRSSSSASSTRAGIPCPTTSTRSPSTTSAASRSRSSSRASRSCCSRTTAASCRSRAAGSPSSARSRTTRSRCSAATPSHVLPKHPEVELGVEIPTVLDELRARVENLTYAKGCEFRGTDRSQIPAAVEAARGADVAVVVLGDRAEMFGRGTSGEGSDAADLSLPGVQAELVREILDTGTPVVLVLVTGRPYALGELAPRVGAIVQAFFPGQGGGQALAEVLTGEVNPSGRLPVSIPAGPGSQPGTYLAAPLARRSEVSSI